MISLGAKRKTKGKEMVSSGFVEPTKPWVKEKQGDGTLASSEESLAQGEKINPEGGDDAIVPAVF